MGSDGFSRNERRGSSDGYVMLSDMITTLSRRLTRVEERSRGVVIGGVRILAGLLWLANIHWKVPPAFGEDTNGGLYKYSASVLRHSTFAPFRWVTEEIILPNFRFFGWFTLLGEITLAALLLIGYRTKAVALAGAAMAVPIMLSVLYYDKADEWSWSYLMMIGLHLLIFASDGGGHLGLDGLLRKGPEAAVGGLRASGVVAVVVGAAGLFVARSIGFAGRQAALLGSDAGFVGDGGRITRRWELKFLWFNPLWALLTIVLGVLLIIGSRRAVAALAGSIGFAVVALVALATQTFDYVRDDGAIQQVATGSNVALWGGLAVAGGLLARRSMAGGHAGSPDSARSATPSATTSAAG